MCRATPHARQHAFSHRQTRGSDRRGQRRRRATACASQSQCPSQTISATAAATPRPRAGQVPLGPPASENAASAAAGATGRRRFRRSTGRSRPPAAAGRGPATRSSDSTASGRGSHAAGWLACFVLQNPVDQLRHAQRQDGVHVVPELPLRQHPLRLPPPAAKPLAKPVQKRIEVVVLDHERPGVGMIGVVVGQVPDDLQPQGRLARALLAEHDRRGRLGRIAVDLVPGRMIGVGDAVALEDQVGLGVFVGKGIRRDPVMFEKRLDFHDRFITQMNTDDQHHHQRGEQPTHLDRSCSARRASPADAPPRMPDGALGRFCRPVPRS